MERGVSRTLGKLPAWKMTWSACRMFSYSRSREFHPKVGRSGRSQRRASGPSWPRNSMPRGLSCPRTCLSRRPDFGTKEKVMSLILLFLLLLVLIFGVLVYFLKPTSIERAVEDQLASIEEAQSVAGERRTTILKENAVGSTVVDGLAQWLPCSQASVHLITQAGRSWSFGSLSLVSLIAGLATYGLASFVNVGPPISVALVVAGAFGPHVNLYVLR